MAVEEKIFQVIHGLTGTSKILEVMGVFFVHYVPYLLLIAIVYFVLKQRGIKKRLLTLLYLIFVGLLSSAILVPLLQNLELGRITPMGGIACFFSMAFLLYILDKKFGQWFLACVCLVSFFNISLGIQYPSALVIEVMIGVIVSLIFRFLFFPKNEVFSASVEG